MYVEHYFSSILYGIEANRLIQFSNTIHLYRENNITSHDIAETTVEIKKKRKGGNEMQSMECFET